MDLTSIYIKTVTGEVHMSIDIQQLEPIRGIVVDSIWSVDS